MAPMKVDVSTELDCSAAKVWSEVQKSTLLLRVIWPLARISTSGLPDLPERWGEGQKVQCWVYVFGFIPLGVRELYFKRIDQNDRDVRERSAGAKLGSHNVSHTVRAKSLYLS